MNTNSAPGTDSIYAQFVKKVFCYLVLPLKIIFQKSIQTGEVPSIWRKGIIVPIYKNNKKPEDPSSYRPVCLTSVVCKLLERIIHTKFIYYLKTNNIISKSQHAFMTKKSTVTNLIECLNDWTKDVDAKKPVDILYIDLAKAFDSVSHVKLLYKLTKIGVGQSLLKWFESFLTEREHCVKVKNVKSPYEKVSSGIPQGTILGPTLFILYVNDTVNLDLSSTLKLFADDAKLYIATSTLAQSDMLQEDLNKIVEYFTVWQLKVNINKCETIHLGFNNMMRNYEINNVIVPTTRRCRDLGIKVSDDAKFSQHCTETVRVAYFRLKQFCLAFSCKDVDFQVHMYVTYIRPLLEYNTPVWSSHLLRDIDKVEGVQRFFTRLLPGL